MNALRNETHLPHIIERRSGKKVKKTDILLILLND